MKCIIKKAFFSVALAAVILAVLAGTVNSAFKSEGKGTASVVPAGSDSTVLNNVTTPADKAPISDDDNKYTGIDIEVFDGTLPADGPFNSTLFEDIKLPGVPGDRFLMGTGGNSNNDNDNSNNNTSPTPDVTPDEPDEDTPEQGDNNNNQSGGNTTLPPVDANKLLSYILDRNYTGGIDIFQGSGSTIPTDTSALYNAIHKGNNVCSFIAVRLSDGATIAYNVNRLYRCASSYKSFVSLYTFKQAAMGNYNLSTGLKYTSADYYSGSGIIKSSAFGTVYTLRQVADYSIRYSDNAAFMMLQRYVDRDALVAYGKELGCPNADGFMQTWPSVSALDAAVWWSEIYEFANTSSVGREYYNILLNATNPSIKKALNGEYAVAHKSGSMSYYYHDCGIVHSEDPYLLVVYTHNPYNYSSSNQTYFASVVREIHKLINP